MLKELIKIAFPKNCLSCSNALVNNENHLCANCYFFLPKGELDLGKNTSSGKIFPELPFFFGSGHLINFDKDGKTQHILHELKYNSNIPFGEYLGKLMGTDFLPFMKEVDFLVPVPLHPKKEHQRGFNQSEVLCRGISEITEIPISTKNLVRTVHTETQTKKNKEERKLNIKNAFSILNPEKMENKTIVLVDDVITTGATLMECIQVVSAVPGISVYTLLLAKANY